MTAEIINWTDKAVVVPRSKLPKLAEREEARRAGIYLLVGDDPENLPKKRVYVGESDNVFDRLKNHQKDASKDFWTQTVFVTSKDENLTKSHVRYLESRLIGLIAVAKQAILAKGTEPAVRGLPEPDVADMEFFLDQIKMLLPVLGFFFVQPTPTPQSKPALEDENGTTLEKMAKPESQDASPLFYMSPVGTYAILLKRSTTSLSSPRVPRPERKASAHGHRTVFSETSCYKRESWPKTNSRTCWFSWRAFLSQVRAPQRLLCLPVTRTDARLGGPKTVKPTLSGKKRNWSRLLLRCPLSGHHLGIRRRCLRVLESHDDDGRREKA